MSKLFKASVALMLCLQVIYAQDFASMIRNCRAQHIERLNECIVVAVKKIQPRMAGGLPELGLPQLDPLALGTFNMSQGDGPVNFKAYFRDLMVSGLSRFDLKYLDINVENRTVHLGCTVPGLTVRGKYEIDGMVFQLPVQGEGPFLALLEGIVGEGIGFIGVRDRQKTTMESMKLEFKIQKFRSKVENLFGGNEVLQNTFTHFLEENSNLVLEEVRPGLVGNMDEFLTRVVNVILTQMPQDLHTTLPNANRLDKHRARTLRVLAAARQGANSPANK